MEEKALQLPEVSLRDYLDLLRRRKAIVIQTFVIVFVVGAVVTFLAKPMYRTSARIVVEGRAFTITQLNANDPLNDLFSPGSGHDVATQIEILQGDELIKKAYQEAQVPAGSVRLDVKEVGTTDVIELTTESSSAAYAEQLASTLPDTYLKFFAGSRKTEISNALNFAKQRLNDENRNLNQAVTALQRVRQQSKIFSVGEERKNQIQEKTLAEAEQQRITTQIAGEEAKLNRLIAERAALSPVIETTTHATNTQIETLRSSIAALQVQRAGLLPLYKPTSTKVQEVDAQIAVLEERLAKMPPLIATTARTPNPALTKYDDDIAQARVGLATDKAQAAKTLARVTQASSSLIHFGSVEPEQDRLESLVDQAKISVAALTKDVNDLTLREKAYHPPMQVITPAGKAALIAPRKTNNLMYAAMLGLILGFCFALLQEFLDDRVNSPEDARRLMGAPTLGYVPLIDEPDMRLLVNSRRGNVLNSSFSLLESYRVLRSNVQFAAVDTKNISILISSTTPGEGKSVTASNLAVVLGLDGKRVILVDTDLRRPTIHEKFGLSQRPGLTNVLVGQMTLDEALQDTEIPGLQILASGPLPPNPAELLNSQAMRQVHQELRDRADIVIFDSPPFLATADAQVLSASVDGVLYVVQFGEAKKSAVRHSVELLRQAHANILGVIFNKIDLSSRRDDYYSGYYGYYKYYSPSLDTGPRRRRTAEFEEIMSRTGDPALSRTAMPVLPAEKDKEDHEA